MLDEKPALVRDANEELRQRIRTLCAKIDERSKTSLGEALIVGRDLAALHRGRDDTAWAKELEALALSARTAIRYERVAELPAEEFAQMTSINHAEERWHDLRGAIKPGKEKLCRKCRLFGKLKDCMMCEELKRRTTREKEEGRQGREVGFDAKDFQKYWGKVYRTPDDFRRETPEFENSPDYHAMLRLLRELDALFEKQIKERKARNDRANQAGA